VSRGSSHKGWTAVTRHSIPWMPVTMPAYDDDVWELYAPDDWTQAHDLSIEMPGKLHELQRLFLIEAVKHNVLPMDDRIAERLNSDIAGRPTLIKGKSQMLFEGMGRLSENVVLNLKNRSHSVAVEVKLPDDQANGVLVAQGGGFGGWSLYFLGGRLKYCFNLLGIRRFYAESDSVVPAGKHQVRMEFGYDGGGLGKGGNVGLFVDGNKVGGGRVDLTMPLLISLDETLDVGREGGSVVTDDYTPSTSKFNGTINWIQLDQGADNHDHLISPEERLKVLLMRH
jgi:hypothetical protein